MQKEEDAIAREEMEACDDNEDENEDDSEADSMDNDANNIADLMQTSHLTLTDPFDSCLHCLQVTPVYSSLRQVTFFASFF